MGHHNYVFDAKYRIVRTIDDRIGDGLANELRECFTVLEGHRFKPSLLLD
jgi:hypothetical protein